jgi:hypothetical protein
MTAIGTTLYYKEIEGLHHWDQKRLQDIEDISD